MHEPADIQVVVADATHVTAIRSLRVAPGQSAFVGDIAFNLADAQRDRLSDAMAILHAGQLVGFYRLDRAPHAVTGRRLDQPHLGLRAFVIDRQHQGRGLGIRAIRACCADALRRYPQRRLLALTVNCDNSVALAAYARAGFRDTGELYPGGPAGPQRLMLCHLDELATDPPSLPGPR
ncbi:GNAT family N-acetyltransferase [Lysobacter sp. A289]